MITHVYQERAIVDADTERRNAFARKTWGMAYLTGSWKQHWLNDNHFYQTAAHTLEGETRDFPYVKDILRIACLGLEDREIICFTNADTCFSPDLAHVISDALSKSECAYGARRDFDLIETPLTPKEIENGAHYPGSDIFVFYVGWWRANNSDYPNMLAGVESVDRILRELIKKYGGIEMKNSVYHEIHDQYWFINRLNSPSNIYNRNLARQWLKNNNIPLAELDFEEKK